ncbi:MAG TPA: 4'-phosphopantetheinyl transferase superfamily protein [Terracidiphilus sp.]
MKGYGALGCEEECALSSRALQLPVPQQSIDVWLTFTDDTFSASLLVEYARLMTENERDREARYVLERDRRRHRITRALVRTVLSRYAPISPEHWNFTQNEYGRPEVAGSDFPLKLPFFNVSHTAGLIAMAVGPQQSVGIDAENFRARRAPLQVTDRFFSLRERVALDSCPPGMRDELFFEYWTLKESYVKACGMGLSIPIHRFGFEFPNPHEIAVFFNEELSETAGRWRFWQFRPRENQVAAVCAQIAGAGRENPAIRKIVPLVSEQTMNCSIQRKSA